MDSAHHANDEMRSMELLEEYRDGLVAQAKDTMLARPGERITGLILDRALPETQWLLAMLPPTQQPTTHEVVGIVPRAWAVEFLARFNPAAADWLPGDDRLGDVYQLPIIVAHNEGLQCVAVTFST